MLGLAYPLLLFFLPLAAIGTLVSRIWFLLRRRLALEWIRRPWGAACGKYMAQLLLRCATYGAALACLKMAIPQYLLTDDEYQAAMLIFGWFPALVAVLLQLFPSKRLSLSVNGLHVAALTYLNIQLAQVYLYSTLSQPIALQPPFRGDWLVFQGGRSSLINHHYALPSQRYALDLVALREGHRLHGDPRSLRSYVSFGQPRYAPASGIVVRATNDRPDQPIGTADVTLSVGNHFVLDLGEGKFALLAHLQQGSVVVQKGDRVSAGDLLARCGNSGNTSEPHLHLQIQDHRDFAYPYLRTFPMRFEPVMLVRGGQSRKGQQGELRRNDLLRATDQRAAAER
ncbi:MAG: M23 family metallopeptidase [Pirellulaceae bacterium]